VVKAGIIDPTKVTRFALQNAASVAGLLLTTEAMVAEKPEKKKAAAAPAMPKICTKKRSWHTRLRAHQGSRKRPGRRRMA
jgi:hypothetical protein